MSIPPEPAALATAIRQAIDNRGQWEMPAAILRFQESGDYLACSEIALHTSRSPAADRAYQVITELDRTDLDSLAGYSEEDLVAYAADVFCW
jgi:hypothetical protein